MLLRATLRAASRVRHTSAIHFVRPNANVMFLGGTAFGAFAATSFAATNTTLCEKDIAGKIEEEVQESRVVANSLHLSDLPDTKIRIFYPIFVDSWYQFFCRLMSGFVGIGGFFWQVFFLLAVPRRTSLMHIHTHTHTHTGIINLLILSMICVLMAVVSNTRVITWSLSCCNVTNRFSRL
jgi:hypothetical protein